MEIQKNTVLVVDDNPQNIQVVANLLTSNGFNVECSTSGAEALIWVSKEKFDLILLDIMMPNMDGFEVCQKIKEIEELSDLPIIFLTAKEDIESITKGFIYGGVDYVTKPFNTEELLARVKTHIDLKQSKEKLKNLNQWLESQVTLRTEELNRSNEELRKAKDKLEELDNTKNEFLKMISHELRNPLNGIIGFSELIKSIDDIEKIKEFIDCMDTSVKRLEKFSIQALEISTLRTIGRKALSVELVDVIETIRSSINEFNDSINRKRLHVAFNSGSSGNLTVKGDQALLKRCFANIIQNAINYSANDSFIYIIVNDSSDKILCKIMDKGKGFSNAILSDPFKPFVVGNEDVDFGTGCGLYHSKLIMDAHAGEISIGNNEDQGAFVLLSFPKFLS